MKGIVQVYTGNGKGKTTAAFGQGMRAAGQGLSVLVIQFLKKGRFGEIKYFQAEVAPMDIGAPRRLREPLKIEQYGGGKFVTPKRLEKIDFELVKKGLKRAKEAIKSEKWEVVVLDEINVAIKFGLIKVDDVLSLIKNKPGNLELILTGRWAHPKIIETADLVTEMKEIKHPFRKGKRAERGREY